MRIEFAPGKFLQHLATNRNKSKRFQGMTVLVVGIGSPHGDDRAGWCAVEHLKHKALAADLRCAGSPADLLNWLEGVQTLLICDAFLREDVSSDAQTRKSQPDSQSDDDHEARWAWPFPSDIAELSWRGTHDMSLLTCLRVAEAVGHLPSRVELWGIEIPCPPQPLDSISAITARRARRVAASISKEVASLGEDLQEGLRA